MTKKEKAFIEARIVQYRKYAKEEYARAKREEDDEAREEAWLQGKLNEDAANTLALILSELGQFANFTGFRLWAMTHGF